VILSSNVGISSEYKLPDTLPGGLFLSGEGDIGIYIGIKTEKPYKSTLRLIPRTVTLGIGCRRGVSADDIAAAVSGVLAQNSIDIRAVADIFSIDVKKDEAGLCGYAESLGVPIGFYSAERLNAIAGEFDESEFVRRTVGVGNVCERAAVCGGGRLIIKKTVCGPVTVAAALNEWSVNF